MGPWYATPALLVTTCALDMNWQPEDGRLLTSGREVGWLGWYMVIGSSPHSRLTSSVLGASFFSSSGGVNQPKKDVFMLFMASF